jgi:hypothetical protein
MLIKNFINLFERDLDKLQLEISSYSSEKNMWKVDGCIINSAGNLCLHLLGNLSHFISKEIGGFDYKRDRDFEFNGKDVPKAELLKLIEKTKINIIVSLEGLDEHVLAKDYPLEVFGAKMSHSFFLLHLYGHFNYHLGQINYHRRLLDSKD